jgi:hypothetical protein
VSALDDLRVASIRALKGVRIGPLWPEPSPGGLPARKATKRPYPKHLEAERRARRREVRKAARSRLSLRQAPTTKRSSGPHEETK